MRLRGVTLKHSDSGNDRGEVQTGEANPLPAKITQPLPAGTNLLGRVDVQAPLPTGTNLIGNVGSIVGTKVGQGRFNLASSGRVALAVAGNLRAIIQNPAGSGRTMMIVRLAAFATNTAWVTLYINPTAGVPTSTARPMTNAIVGGGVPSIAVLRVDTNTTTPLSGGLDTGLVFGVPGNARTTLDLPPLVLAPGVTLGINVPFAGAADTSMSLYWYEE